MNGAQGVDTREIAKRLRAVASRLEQISNSDQAPSADELIQVDLLAVALQSQVAHVQEQAAARAGHGYGLAGLARAHANDAQTAQRWTGRFYLGLAADVVAAAAVLLWGLLAVPSGATGWQQVPMGQLVLSSLLAIGAVPLWIQAERHRRTAAESRRLQHQFAAIDSYLEPMPERSRVIMRAALAPRLFSRVLEDDDPIREPAWPLARDLYPYEDSVSADLDAEDTR